VLILSPRFDPLRLFQKPDVEVDAEIQSILTNGFVPGLRAEGVPVRVLHVARYRHLDYGEAIEELNLEGEGFLHNLFMERFYAKDAAVWKEDMKDLANADTDCVTVTSYYYAYGLERRVVVCLVDKVVPFTDRDYLDQEDLDKLRMWARCTTQLIKVEIPSDSSRRIGCYSRCDNSRQDHNSETGDSGVLNQDKQPSQTASTKEEEKHVPGVSWARKGFLN
jgi:hypothetical protein